MQTYAEFQDALRSWLLANAVPARLHRRLFDKIQHSVFDSGLSFSLARWPRSAALSGSDTDDDASGAGAAGDAATPTSAQTYPGYYLVASRDLHPEDIWLVDHCCTFQLPTLRDELLRNAALRDRLATIVRLEQEPQADEATAASVERQVDRLWAHLWPYVESYELLNPRHDDAQRHYWFVADEIGSALNSSFDPEAVNTRLLTLPFYFAAQQCVLSLLWVTAPVEAGAVLTRRPRHRFESYGTDAVSRVLYEMWSGEPPPVDVVLACRAAWQSHYRQQAHIAAQRAVREAIAAAAREALGGRRQDGDSDVVEGGTGAVHPPLSLALSAGTAGAQQEPQPATTIPVYVSHRGVAVALAGSASFGGRAAAAPTSEGPTAAFRLVSLPSEAAVVWMAHHVFRGAGDFASARLLVHLPEQAQLAVPRNLAALLQVAVGKTPLVADHLDGVTQLRELIGSAVEEGGTDGRGGGATWELLGEDGRRVWGPVALDGWPRVREVVRVAETAALCLRRVHDAEALTLAAGTRMVLHFPVLVRSLQSSTTALQAYLHSFSWASFVEGTTSTAAAAAQMCGESLAGCVVETQLAALVGRADVWAAEVLPAVRGTVRALLAAVAPMSSVDHARLGAVWDAQFQLLLHTAGAVSPVLLGFGEQVDCSAALQHCPSFEDALTTLCFGTPNATPL